MDSLDNTFLPWRKTQQSQSAKVEGYRLQEVEMAQMVKLASTVHCALTTQFLLFVSYTAMKANLVFKLDQFSFLNELR